MIRFQTGQRVFSLLQSVRLAVAPQNLLVTGCPGRQFQGISRPGREAHYSSTCIAGFMNEWSYTAIPSCLHVVQRDGVILSPLCFVLLNGLFASVARFIFESAEQILISVAFIKPSLNTVFDFLDPM